LNLNACRVIIDFYKIWPGILKKTVITLQALRFKLKRLARTIFSDSATFIEKKRVENQLWPKSEFSWPKKIKSLGTTCCTHEIGTAALKNSIPTPFLLDWFQDVERRRAGLETDQLPLIRT
jgi:hypothetical protein